MQQYNQIAQHADILGYQKKTLISNLISKRKKGFRSVRKEKNRSALTTHNNHPPARPRIPSSHLRVCGTARGRTCPSGRQTR